MKSLKLEEFGDSGDTTKKISFNLPENIESNDGKPKKCKKNYTKKIAT